MPNVSMLKVHKEGILLEVYAQPGGRCSEIMGMHDGRLKIRIHAPPVDGKANEELIKFLAKKLGLGIKAIRLHRGDSSRQKSILIEGLSLKECEDRLL